MEADRLARMEPAAGPGRNILDCLTRFKPRYGPLRLRSLPVRVFSPTPSFAAGDFVGGPADLYEWATAMHERGQVAHAPQPSEPLLRDRRDNRARGDLLLVRRAEPATTPTGLLGGRLPSTGCNAATGLGGSPVADQRPSNGRALVPTMPLPFAEVCGHPRQRCTVTQQGPTRRTIGPLGKPSPAVRPRLRRMPDEEVRIRYRFSTRIAAIDIHTHVEVDGPWPQGPTTTKLVEAVGASTFKMGARRAVERRRVGRRIPATQHGLQWCSPHRCAHRDEGTKSNSVEDLIAGAVRQQTTC